MKRARRREPPLDHHPLAVAQRSMARGAVDLEAPAPPRQQTGGQRHGQVGRQIVADPASVEVCVLTQAAPGNRARDQGAGGEAVGVKSAGLQRLVARLVVHVLPAPQ